MLCQWCSRMVSLKSGFDDRNGDDDMFWKINYVVDDGYTWHKKVCIVKAGSKERALEILYEEISKKLKGERIILSKYTEITKCENDVILYNGSR